MPVHLILKFLVDPLRHLLLTHLFPGTIIKGAVCLRAEVPGEHQEKGVVVHYDRGSTVYQGEYKDH